jgi:hypothetical protein
METMVREDKNGKYCILIRLIKTEQRESIRSSDFTSIDHSISDQECHSKEFLSATELTMFGSRDGEEM